MSWCPKCKQEFQDGITVCPTCDETLVKELDTTVVMKEINFFSEEEVNKFISFLEYSNILNTDFERDDTLGLYYIRCEEDDVQEIVKLFKAFKSVEEEIIEEAETEEELEEEAEEAVASAPYVKKKDQYADANSTGYMLVIIGVIGLGYVALNYFDILHLLNGIIPYSLNILLFSAAIIYGIYSLHQAKLLKEQIAEEEALAAEITKWLDENLTEEFLAKVSDSSLPKEANFLKQLTAAKKLVLKQFPDVKENFLESLVEEKMNEE